MPRAKPKPHVEIKPYTPGQALPPPTPIEGEPPPLDGRDPNATPEHEPEPDPAGGNPHTDDHIARELDQAAALGLSIEEYRALQPPDPQLLDPVPTEPTMPGFSMSDQPFEAAPSFAERPDHPPPLLHDAEHSPPRVPDTGITPASPPPGAVRYESRITIVEAWRYQGNLVGAPDWIDKNWIGYGDFDDARKIEPGPCLRVPVYGDPFAIALCRIGDYMARQEVKITPDLPGEIRIQVWEAEQFQRLFIPRVD